MVNFFCFQAFLVEDMDKVDTYMTGKNLNAVLMDCMDSVLYQQLVLHTIVRLRGRYGMKAPNDEVEDKACELVQELLESMMVEQSRKWNEGAYPKIEMFLKSAIDSHLYNHFKRTKVINQGLDTLNPHDGLMLSEQVSHEQVIVTDELKENIRSVLKELEADDDEMMVFECLFDGLRKPKEIRKELGLTEAEFGSIWRRVGRKQKKLQEKLL